MCSLRKKRKLIRIIDFAVITRAVASSFMCIYFQMDQSRPLFEFIYIFVRLTNYCNYDNYSKLEKRNNKCFSFYHILNRKKHPTGI